MIIRPIRPLTLLWIRQGSFFKRIGWPLLLLFLFSSAIYYYQGHTSYRVPLNASVFTLLGIALAIFHGFCNTAAYDRFWEGRKLWGALVWQSRNLARQVMALPNVPLSERQALLRLVISFAHALRHQLRHQSAEAALQRILPQEQAAHYAAQPFICTHLLQDMGELIARWQAQDQISPWVWQHLDNSLQEIAHIQAGCERISNTPIPFSYFVMLHRTVYLYCFLLPFGLGNTIGWVTPIMATFVGYTFMTLNELVDELSDPFGLAENDLPLGMMCDTIETQLAALSGQHFAPAPQPDLPRYVVQ